MTPRTAPSSTHSCPELDLGNVISISEVARDASRRSRLQSPRADMAMAAPVPVEPGQQTVGFSVTVVWELDD